MWARAATVARFTQVMRRWVCAAAVLSLGCGSGTEPDIGEEFSLGVGERATLADLSLFVSFIAVEDDSRCPLQVQCVWPGDALVLLEIASLNSDSKTDTLHTNTAVGPDILDWGRAVLRLIRLDPYPETPGSIPSDAYIVRLVTEAR